MILCDFHETSLILIDKWGFNLKCKCLFTHFIILSFWFLLFSIFRKKDFVLETALASVPKVRTCFTY